MSLKDHIQQELKRVNELAEMQARDARNMAEKRLEKYCDLVEIKIKDALAQNLQCCTINVPPEYTAEKVMDAVFMYKNIPLKSMSIRYDDNCPCGSNNYGCTCSASELSKIVPKKAIVISFKRVCEDQ
jgi:hypothetical protein